MPRLAGADLSSIIINWVPPQLKLAGTAGKRVGLSVVEYRTFRNTDPPHLTEIWNEIFAGHGGVRLANRSVLECCVFSKPYFDPAGLFVAEEDGVCLGFCHGGFGPNLQEAALSRETGVVCLLGVRPSQQRRGIGAQLLGRCEAYLKGQGARVLFAGPHWPLAPFYQGLYGGSDLPGFLVSESQAEPFFLKHEYHRDRETLIFRRRVADPVRLNDPRLIARRGQYELRVSSCKSLGTWWRECVMNPIEPLDFSLVDKKGESVASALVWDMDGHAGRGASAVGILGLVVNEPLRRQGLGRLFVSWLFRMLHDQYFEVAEIQVEQENETGQRFCLSVGFELADRGRVYRK